MRTPPSNALRCLVSIALMAACSDSTSAPVPAAFTATGGNDQSGVVAATLASPLAVRATDDRGNGLGGVPVTWTVKSGGGAIVEAATTTDAQGTATARWRLGPSAGMQQASAAISGLAPVSFTAQATPAAAIRIRFAADTLRFDAGRDSVLLQLTAEDQYGNVLQPAAQFVVEDASIVEVRNGYAISRRSGRTRITATSGTVSATIGVRVDQVPVRIGIISTSDTINALGDTLTLRASLLDRNNVEIAGLPVIWATSDTLVTGSVQNGRVIGLGLGAATVRATSGLFSAEKTIVVRQVPASLTLSHTRAASIAGDTATVTAIVRDSNQVSIANALIQWASTDPGIVLTRAGGLIEATGPGKADVIATFGRLSARLTWVVVSGRQQIAGGDDHFCAIAETRRIYCWGSTNAVGQLGITPTIDRSPEQIAAVESANSFIAVMAGAQLGCGLTEGGKPICWGRNDEGQLANNTTTPRPLPDTVWGSQRFVDVRGGGATPCGLMSSGEAWCWGRFLTNPLAAFSQQPLQQHVDVAGYHASLAHTCVVTTSSIAVCYGRNQAGQLGRGFSSDTESLFVPVTGHSFRQVVNGPTYSCGITIIDEVYCWGVLQELFGTKLIDRAIPLKIDDGFLTIAAGYSAVCGIKRDSYLYCFGDNTALTLGRTGASSLVPTRVDGNFVPYQLALSGQGTACMITTDARVLCWGARRGGVPNTGTLTAVPEPITGGVRFGR